MVRGLRHRDGCYRVPRNAGGPDALVSRSLSREHGSSAHRRIRGALALSPVPEAAVPVLCPRLPGRRVPDRPVSRRDPLVLHPLPRVSQGAESRIHTVYFS